jgi:hypothetical protein
MVDAFTAARKRQLARLRGARPPAPRAAIALAQSQAYQDAADAPATLRAYATDLANYKAWCDRQIATVESGQESSGVITPNSASPGLIFYQNSVGGRTFIEDDICLPLLNDPVRIAETVRRNEVDGTFRSGGWTATLV